MKTGQALADYAESLLSAKANTWYMYGNNGRTITEQFIQVKKIQYPDRYSDDHIRELRKHIGKTGYDCSSITDLFVGPDRSANGWLAASMETGPIMSIPETVGLTVHYNGHMGIYVGNGWVVEARGTWYGIVKTKLSDRPWKNWAKVPGVDYTEGDMVYIKYNDGRETSTSSSMAVRVVQNALLKLGVKMINGGKEFGADGRYGDATSNGVNAYKLLKSLPGGGQQVESDMLTALLADLNALEADQAALDAAQEQINRLEKTVAEKAASVQTVKAQYNKLASAALVIRDAVPLV
jgi:hypothetical protein